MLHNLKRARRGFSLVELLAVVLVLAVLAAVAVPLYMSQRASAAARACKANIAAIAAAESAWALRNDAYTATMDDLVGASEGLAETPTCPLAGKDYTLTIATSGALTIACPDDAVHANVMGAAGDWTRVMAPSGADTLP